VDRDLEVPLDQLLLELARARIDDLELDAGVAALHTADEVDELVRRDRAHHPELQRGFLQLDEVEGLAPRLARLAVDLLEIGLHHAPELGQVRVRALAMEQRPAELALEELDRPRQRGLRHVAALGGAREVELVRDGEEVADLVHLHGIPLSGCCRRPDSANL
jgi:hypothetical protein